MTRSRTTQNKRRSVRSRSNSFKQKKSKKRSTNTGTNSSNSKNILKVDNGKFGWSKAVRNKNFVKFVLKAEKQGVKTIVVDNFPDSNDTYNVKNTVNKIKNNAHVLRY